MQYIQYDEMRSSFTMSCPLCFEYYLCLFYSIPIHVKKGFNIRIGVNGRGVVLFFFSGKFYQFINDKFVFEMSSLHTYVNSLVSRLKFNRHIHTISIEYYIDFENKIKLILLLIIHFCK